MSASKQYLEGEPLDPGRFPVALDIPPEHAQFLRPVMGQTVEEILAEKERRKQERIRLGI